MNKTSEIAIVIFDNRDDDDDVSAETNWPIIDKISRKERARVNMKERTMFKGAEHTLDI